MAATSLPTRERELKHVGVGVMEALAESLPTRERELKHALRGSLVYLIGRSLHGSVN